MEGLLLLGLIVGIPLLFRWTDRMGWTTLYAKKPPGTFLGSAMLGMEQLFAHEEKREALEYRLQDKRTLREKTGGDSK